MPGSNIFTFIILQLTFSWRASSLQSSNHCYSKSCFVSNGTSTLEPESKSQEFYGSYPFPISCLPSAPCKSLDALNRIYRGEPVVLKNCHLADVTKKWSLEYLNENILSNDLSMTISSSKICQFYREKIHTGKYPWRRPDVLRFTNFSTFLNMKREMEEADNGSRIYLRSQLDNDELTTAMQDDIFSFDFPWLGALKRLFKWGEQKYNLLTVGMRDVITPAHYDIWENIFLQIHGKKRCILFHPNSWRSLYAYPVHHAYDRHSQVDLENIDFQKFPNVKFLKGWEAILEPGDVLHIPIYWWHYFVSWSKSHTVSYNFWFMPNTTPEYLKVLAPVGSDKNKNKDKKRLPKWMALGLTRKVERMIGDILQDHSLVGSFLKDIADRFTHL